MVEIKNQTSFYVETATYESGSSVPGISGYGDNIAVQIVSTGCDSQTTIIKIGDNIFLPPTLDWIIEEVEKHNSRLGNNLA